MREDVAIKKVIGREEIPDPTTAGDFCRRFKLGQIAQIEEAFTEIRQEELNRTGTLSAETRRTLRAGGRTMTVKSGKTAPLEGGLSEEEIRRRTGT